LLVLVYDRTFVSGSLASAWHRHGRLHAFLVATWGLLAYFVITAGHMRAGVIETGAILSPWSYLLTQCRAIVHYLRLAVWPDPLVVDYGTATVTQWLDVLPQAALLAALFLGTLFALWRKWTVGFMGLWFFAILAPSSSVVPLPAQTMAEHRMYLPLAAVLGLAVAALRRMPWRFRLGCGVALALAFCGLTIRRNEDYRSGVRLWQDTARKVPDNARARYNLAICLGDANRPMEAVAEYETALRLAPDYHSAENNLGTLLDELGRTREAILHYEAALRADPTQVQAHVNLGHALLKTDRFPEAIAHYETALRLDPKLALVHVYWGTALMQEGQPAEALPHFEKAVHLEPGLLQARAAYAAALTQLGRLGEAIAQSEAAVRLKPDSPDARVFFAHGLLRAGRLPEAKEQFEEALRLVPDHQPAREGLARVRGLWAAPQ
jgi:protein O-mannosyl-transferase